MSTGRFRSFARRGVLTAAVILTAATAAAWLASLGRGVDTGWCDCPGDWWVRFCAGRGAALVQVSWTPANSSTGSAGSVVDLWNTVLLSTSPFSPAEAPPGDGFAHAGIRLWLPSVLLIVAWYVLLRVPHRVRRILRAKRGLCLQCGYNLTGNWSGVCPECGTGAQTPRPASDRAHP